MIKEDVNFVHSLYAQANAQLDSKAVAIFWSIVSFFIVAFMWASNAYIDELARGTGKVIPAEKIQTIQSLDGGILSDIIVKEGDRVTKNQNLMKIDTTRFKASLDEQKQAYYSSLATKARLMVEYKIQPKNIVPKIQFPKELLKHKNLKELIYSEQKLLESRVSELQSNLSIFENQLGQKVQELIELKSKEKQLKKTRKFIVQEADTIRRLVRSGAKSKIDLIAIEKELNQVDGDIEATKLSIPRSELAIKEAKAKILEKLKNFKSEVAVELQKTNAEIKKLKSKIVSEKDKLNKTVIKSPVDGIIKTININTIGGVVKSGMDLIEIVPDSEILLVEARIDPKDIAFINPNQKVIIKFTAYDFSIYGGLEGKITEISADSIIDKNSKDNKPYYKVVIRANTNHLEMNGDKLAIIPGMVTSVDIVTGKKTILDFILKPILKTKQSALHER
jgi:adhesin transport system membrane fusion protein